MPTPARTLAWLLLGLSASATAQAVKYGCEADRIFDNQPPGSPVPANAEPGCGLLNDHFGSAVAVGDFNGDGFPDLLVGGGAKPDPSTPNTLTRAWLMVTQGSPGSWQRRHWVKGNGALDLLGFSVGALKSVNGDLRDEFIVAAPSYPVTTVGRGKVYVGYGLPNDPSLACTIDGVIVEGPAMEDVHAFAIEGTVVGAWLGMGIATGDVDGNGLQDLLLGAPGSVHSDPAGYPGRAFLVRDGTLAQIVADVAANGAGQEYTLSTLAGTPGVVGSVITADVVFNIVANGVSTADRFGRSVSFVGDLDGVPGEEFAIGAPEWVWDTAPPIEPVDRGYVQLYRWDSATGTAPMLLRMSGTQDGEAFGWVVAGGANFEPATDPSPEVLVGSPLYDVNPQAPPAEVDAGRVRMFRGAAAAAGLEVSLLTGNPADPNGTVMYGYIGDRFGFAVAASKSVNSGLTDDIVVGAILHTPDVAQACSISQGARLAGTVYVFDSGTSTALPAAEIRGEKLRDRIGWCVVAGHFAGVLSGPAARADIVTGGLAWDQPAGGLNDVGRMYVFEGGTLAP